MADATTLPRLLLRNAREFGLRTAMREKDRGIWQSWTWSDYADHVRAFALGLHALGFERGDRLSVIGDNRPRLYAAQIAAQCLGGVSVPVYQDSIAKELAYVWNHAEVAVILAEDQEQVDKVLALKAELPALRYVIYDDPRGMAHYRRHEWLKSFADVEALGRERAAADPAFFEAAIEQGQPGDAAMICYTSGTTGTPKGAMISHASGISVVESYRQAEDLRPGDDWLAYLPMAWVGDAFYTLFMGLVIGFASNCPESPETVQRDLRELGPTIVLAPPRIWENMLTSVLVRAGDAPPLKRRVFERFRAVAERVETLRADGKPVPLPLRVAYAFGEVLVYGPVRDQLGLRRARWALTGGAPLGPDTFRFFRAIGVNLKQVYGSTEAGLVSLQPSAEANPDSAGRPCPGIDVKIGERGEVLVKSAGIFRGYLKNEEATREVIDAEGWFHTGDAGFIDPRGHLVIIDRAKDVGALDDGTPFAPQFIENKLKFSPYIREAVAFGHERAFVTAMIAIDMNTVGTWAERRAIPYTSYADLSQNVAVRGFIRDEIAKINGTLPDATKVRRVLLLAKDLDADDAEITRTRKVRRGFVAEKYAEVIDAFYTGRDEVELTTSITYEDGRTATMQSRVTIEDVTAPAGVGVSA